MPSPGMSGTATGEGSGEAVACVSSPPCSAWRRCPWTRCATWWPPRTAACTPAPPTTCTSTSPSWPPMPAPCTASASGQRSYLSRLVRPASRREGKARTQLSLFVLSFPSVSVLHAPYHFMYDGLMISSCFVSHIP